MGTRMEAEAAVWPALRVVARMHGSLPMGGVVPHTPIHAFETTPEALRLDDTLPAAQRRDIELGGLLAFTISDVTSKAEADSIRIATERMGYHDEAPGIATPPGMRMNKTVHWVADEALLGGVMSRIKALLPRELGGDVLHPRLSHRLNMYRYDDQDRFNRHTDGNWPGYALSPDRSHMLEWPALRSGLTMLLYLNGPEDGVVGGHTRLYRPDGSWVDVTPRKGEALFFRHGFGPTSVVHEGCPVHGAVPKYVARMNVMYGPGVAPPL